MSNIYLFDVDGTLTPAKSRIDLNFKNIFMDWMCDKEVYIVSGGSFVRLIDQLGTDIIDLTEQVPFGIMREIHRWGAHAMVIAVWLHMFRVFMTGSYKPPREFNWSIGVILLILTLLLSFTGYLLPWDQLAIWAIAVGSNMAGATPFLGSEGPGASLLAIGDVNFITKASDARFGLIGGRFLG